jgi:transcriptional regulator NrdR family protein
MVVTAIPNIRLPAVCSKKKSENKGVFMECPRCGSLKNKVVDSRLTKDRISIRRRRQCLVCSKRFTTYEATEERMLPVLIQRKGGYRMTKNNLKIMLSFISHTLSELSYETKKLMVKVDKLNKAQAATASKRQAVVKAASKKKTPLQKTAGRKRAALTLTDTVLKIVRRYQKGVGISTLKAKTGFSEKQIRNIVYRATRQGKTRRIGRGIYTLHEN